ncbi:hypothetical protein FNV43_RR17547 [Rhamnella rubrinervis]|uniref:Uncharacterized protein n=1 Tax=Rhamnella rubrinervis TaxID=2594499 RepID=A0A8K0GVH4_9ROSA|nr:hypothetical protein FNV43_RR17547 [Rhamnella rubrinervis]
MIAYACSYDFWAYKGVVLCVPSFGEDRVKEIAGALYNPGIRFPRLSPSDGWEGEDHRLGPTGGRTVPPSNRRICYHIVSGILCWRAYGFGVATASWSLSAEQQFNARELGVELVLAVEIKMEMEMEISEKSRKTLMDEAHEGSSYTSIGWFDQ